MNERNMRLMMKRMGMTTESMDDVREVIIRRAKEEVVLRGAEVTVVTVQGVKTYQITGEATTRPLGSAPPAAAEAEAPSGGAAALPAGPPEEDVDLVMQQSQCDRPTAIAALKASGGEPAEAILKILSQRRP
jgi:nascent polypeptide-associated complex subunit alpha